MTTFGAPWAGRQRRPPRRRVLVGAADDSFEGRRRSHQLLLSMLGGRCARTGARCAVAFSISTSTCWPVEPWARRDVPRSGVSTLGLPCTHIGRRPSRVEPRAGRQLHDRRAHVVGDDGAGQAGAPVVEHPHDVAVGDAARRGVVGVDADRLAARDLGRLAVRAGVELAVQPAPTAGWR